MPDFVALKAKLGDWLAVDTGRLADSVRGDCINLAMRDLSREHDFWFGETTLAMNLDPLLVQGVPNDFSRPHSLWYRHPTTGKIVFLDQKSKEEFDILFPDTDVVGLPTIYTLWQGSLWFGPALDQTIVATLNYYAVPADLTDAVNTNLFIQYAWEALFFRALVYASKYLIEDPRLPVWEQGARDAELKLVIEHARARHSGGRLVIEEPG